MIKNPKPMHPGKVLSEFYMNELNLNQTELANLCGCLPRKINDIVNCKRAITPDFALDLEKAIGTSAEMWVQMQADFDLWSARQKRTA
ncbi:XRE family plasmid maintenance system antidote protein [Bdellovibrio bacteriovorus W]|nr:XRE family plasmid maintenance system antidote protein [Bdellovibrio bacteriovorus W]